MVKVSVLTYVKNDAAHIEKCMRSVMQQDMDELEYLVIDGGSTDGTREIIERLSAEDARIWVIDTEPGLGHQFNVGVKAAKGEYIGICESDDYLLPRMYSYQYEIAHKYGVDMLRADAYDFFQVDGQEKKMRFGLPGLAGLKNRLLEGDECKQAFAIGVNRFFSGLYRREFLTENELYMNETPGAAYQDNTFGFLTLINAKKIYISDEPYYCYCLDNPNASVNSPERLNMVDVEYRLLKDRLIERGEWEDNKENYLTWMILNHIWFCDLIVTELRMKAIGIFYDSVHELVSDYEFDNTRLRQQDRDIIEAVSASRDVFIDKVKGICTRIDVAKESISQLDSSKWFVIFGAGNIGRLVLYALKKHGIKPYCMMDNNSSLWDTDFEGIRVYSPNKVKEFPDNTTFIIANVDHNTEIREQLSDYGVDKSRMIVCDNYDYTIRRILMEA